LLGGVVVAGIEMTVGQLVEGVGQFRRDGCGGSLKVGGPGEDLNGGIVGAAIFENLAQGSCGFGDFGVGGREMPGFDVEALPDEAFRLGQLRLIVTQAAEGYEGLADLGAVVAEERLAEGER